MIIYSYDGLPVIRELIIIYSYDGLPVILKHIGTIVDVKA